MKKKYITPSFRLHTLRENKSILAESLKAESDGMNIEEGTGPEEDEDGFVWTE